MELEINSSDASGTDVDLKWEYDTNKYPDNGIDGFYVTQYSP